MSYSSRRSFLKAAGAVTAATSLGAGWLSAAPLHLPVGLQLYSVRELLPKDFDGTLAKVHAAGYTVVEAAGYYDRTAQQFRKSMDQAGLRCVSTHHTLKQLQTQLEQWIDYGHTLGLEYIVCSSSGGVHRNPQAKGPQTLDDWRWIASEFNRVGERVKAAGMTFGVHNHQPEFANFNGDLVYDELLRLTNPELVVFEMDAGWVYAAGYNPIDYLKLSPKRFQLMHVKDMVRQPGGKVLLPVMGKGNMNYGAIMRAATGVKYYFIEQERFDMEPMEELRLDAEYMRKLNV